MVLIKKSDQNINYFGFEYTDLLESPWTLLKLRQLFRFQLRTPQSFTCFTPLFIYSDSFLMPFQFKDERMKNAFNKEVLDGP